MITLHEEDKHERLAPDDLMNHLVECHGVQDPADIETRVNVEGWFEERGIESTGSRDLDLQTRWHTLEHEKAERMWEVTVPITFRLSKKVGDLPMFFKVEWVTGSDENHPDREYELDCGAGCGSSLMEATVREGDRRVYAVASIKDVVRVLWGQMDQHLD